MASPPSPAPGIWRFSDYLPVPTSRAFVSMNEGNTSLVPSRVRKNVYYKCEFENPTGSFKDRGSTVEISHAKADGFKRVICASTGNMGASIAAYSARAGIEATIAVPHHVPENKLNQILAYGAKLVKVKGDYTAALKHTWEMAGDDQKIMLTGDYPLRMEGQKTIGFEIVDQLRGKAPDNIVIPVGNGTLLVAIHAAFAQMLKKKKITHLPKLIGVQAANCNPLAEAWKTNTLLFHAQKNPSTIAGAIECGNPVYGQEALAAVHATNGRIYSVTDPGMRAAKISLAREEGLYTEYSGAAVQAVLEDIPFPGKTVGILGGHGLKE